MAISAARRRVICVAHSLSQEELDRLHACFRNFKSIRAIAEATGIHRSTVYYYLSRYEAKHGRLRRTRNNKCEIFSPQERVIVDKARERLMQAWMDDDDNGIADANVCLRKMLDGKKEI